MGYLFQPANRNDSECPATRSPNGSKKAQQLPPLEATLSSAQPREALDFDEVWSFVRLLEITTAGRFFTPVLISKGKGDENHRSKGI